VQTFPYTADHMRLPFAAPAVSTLGALLLCALLSSCVRAPPIHPRAVENNQFCAQYIVSGDLDKAEVYCDLSLQFSPFYPDAWVNKGLIHLKRGNNDKAKDAFIKALRYNQEMAQAYNNLGWIYLQEKDCGKAHDNFQRALKVNPDYTEARWNLAQAFFCLKKPTAARKELNTILAINANLADPHNLLCTMDIEAHDCKNAIYHCETATQLDASYAIAWFNLGISYTDCGQLQDARDAYTSCLKADPENIQCQNNLAIINRKIALLDPAINEMKTRETAENTPQSMYNLGKTFGDKGLKYEERRYYKKCLELDPKYPQCHFGLFKLYEADQRLVDAKNACRNFLKFALGEEFPRQVEECTKYVGSH
jgi:tetratricopeptide (TPR) repeat protein